MGTLTDRTIKTAKAKDTRYELSDGDGLFLAVEPNGKKIFRTRTRTKANVKEQPLAPTLFSASRRRGKATT